MAASQGAAIPGGLTISAEAGVRIETIGSEAEFAALADSWDELVRSMPRPSPFLLHSWLLTWWRHYGGDAELQVHVAYRGTRLVGAFPLSSRRRLGLQVVEFVGGTWALLADLLIAPTEEAYTAKALVEHALSFEHDFANLFGLPASSLLFAVLPRNSLRLVERLEAPVLDLGSGWDTIYRSKLSSRARNQRSRGMRQLAELGTVETSVARTRDELEAALEDAYRIYELRWRGRHDPSGFVTPVGKRFHREALLRLAEADVPRLVTIRLDGRPIAFALSLQLSDRTYGLTRAFNPAYGRFSPGSEAKLQSLEAASDEGMVRAEFLGAAAPHNQRFTDRFEPIYQGIGLAQSLQGRAAVEALVAGIRVRRRIKRSSTARKLYRRLRQLYRG